MYLPNLLTTSSHLNALAGLRYPLIKLMMMQVVPIASPFQNAGQQMNVAIAPYSINSFDLPLIPRAYVSDI